LYRNVTGNEATAMGLIAAAKRSNCELFLGSYPITPASDILHELSKHKNFGVRTFQAEDEIAAITSAIGAAFGGAMALTTSSGPGIALKQEAMGLAVMTELPLIIINVQRGGPSTGLPTKTEQADLMQAMFGRNGECPIPIVAAQSPADCFDIVQEAWRIATRYMTPVIVLTDGYLANGSEPWRIPDAASLTPIEVKHPGPALGVAGHAGIDAPHRRPGKAGRNRQRQLRAGKPPAHGEHASPQSGWYSPRHSRTNGARPGDGQAVGRELGGHLWGLRHGRARSSGSGRFGRPHPSSLFESDAAQPWPTAQTI
jgi:sulfopyruvate decarboxylase TPP-binding subunit